MSIIEVFHYVVRLFFIVELEFHCVVKLSWLLGALSVKINCNDPLYQKDLNREIARLLLFTTTTTSV